MVGVDSFPFFLSGITSLASLFLSFVQNIAVEGVCSSLAILVIFPSVWHFFPFVPQCKASHFYSINLACFKARPYRSNFSVQIERKPDMESPTWLLSPEKFDPYDFKTPILDHWDAAPMWLPLIALLMVFLREINVSLCIIHFDKLNNWSDGSFRRPELWLMACQSKFSSFFFSFLAQTRGTTESSAVGGWVPADSMLNPKLPFSCPKKFCYMNLSKVYF